MSAPLRQDFDPAVGDIVEYEIFETGTAPGGWAVAQVQARFDALWQLRWPEQGPSGEVLMPRSRLRPCSSREGNVAGVLQKEEVMVDPLYVRWLDSSHAAIAFRRVECLAVGLQTGDARCAPSDLLKVHGSNKKEAKVIAVGTKKAVQRAKMLIPSILQNQEKAKRFEEAQHTRNKALAERQAKKIGEADPRRKAVEGFFKEEFTLRQSAVGRFIGKSGANIQALQKEHGVRILVEDAEDPDVKRVFVLGPKEEAVHAVRDLAEVVEHRLTLEKGRKSWALGRNGTVAGRVQTASGLTNIRFDDPNYTLVFEGTRPACELARHLYDAHLTYFDTFRGFDETMEDLVARLRKQGELRECIWPPPVISAKGRGKGRPRPPEGRSVSPAAERKAPERKMRWNM
ncbi:fmr1 [Symbiodinium pilosum]|uniref:Fmr1 protein n=1 Tax=Symbiodinium pilosum TaxID=2952 RepID=A0A812W684_SYMPI|nr:fmr1 [Symbiodinium pilosum]